MFILKNEIRIDHFKLLEYGFIYVMPAKGGFKSQSCQVLLNQLRQGTYLGDFFQISYDKVCWSAIASNLHIFHKMAHNLVQQSNYM